MSLKAETQQVRTTSLGWMIQRIARRLDAAMEQRLSRHDMTLQQFAVMMTVLETEALSQAEIGTRFEMPAYAISRAIDHLEHLGHVERRPHPTSRRTLTIHATERGHAISEALFAIVSEVNDELAATLSPADRAQFQALLSQVVNAGHPGADP